MAQSPEFYDRDLRAIQAQANSQRNALQSPENCAGYLGMLGSLSGQSQQGQQGQRSINTCQTPIPGQKSDELPTTSGNPIIDPTQEWNLERELLKLTPGKSST